MATEIKTPLFRFKSTRAPQLLTDQQQDLYFISAPEDTSGHFQTELASANGSVPYLEQLQLVASSYDEADILTEQAVKDLSNDIHDLGLFIVKNRSHLTLQEFSDELNGVSALSTANLKKVWQNLYYQTATLESGYMREALIRTILVQHCINKISEIADDNSAKRLAHSKVVLPEFMFSDAEAPEQRATGITRPSDIGDLMNEVELAEKSITLSLWKEAREEVHNYFQSELKKAHQANKTAMESYKNSILQAGKDFSYSSTRATAGPSGQAPAAPSYNEIRITWSTMKTKISLSAAFILEENGLSSEKSFEQLLREIEAHIQSVTKELFRVVGFENEKMSIDGTIIEKGTLRRRVKRDHSFAIRFIETSKDEYKAFLVLDLASDDVTVDSVNLTVQNLFDETLTDFSTQPSQGLLSFDLTPDSTLTLSRSRSGDSCTVSGSVTLTSGQEFTISNTSITASKASTGVMENTDTEEDLLEVYVPSEFGLTRLGISEYKVVEETLCCYVPGEVSHIENVMAREYKERSTRRLRKSEDTRTSTASIEEEQSNDTSTTSRHDMQQETSQVLSETIDRSRDFSVHAGVSGGFNAFGQEARFDISADYGTNFATSNSQEDSQSQSVSFAKDITEKALQRVVTNIKEERIAKIIEEFEENNRHGFDNRKGADHISGVFRWVDKVYKNTIRNYGKRLQYEFMVPDPSSFHLISKKSLVGGVELVEPKDPRIDQFGEWLDPIKSAADISRDNYLHWANAYGAQVSPPPPEFINTGKVLTISEGSSLVSDELMFPSGYEPSEIYYGFSGSSIAGPNDEPLGFRSFSVHVGSEVRKIYGVSTFNRSLYDSAETNTELRYYRESIPISARIVAFNSGAVNIELKSKVSHELFEQWQITTFNAIIDAFEIKRAEYKSALAEQEAKRGIMMADNPAHLRRIEQVVLKKNCISYLFSHTNLGKGFVSGSSTQNQQVVLNEEMDKYAASVKFFEQAFEWSIMSYHFYPFYWADKDRWLDMYKTDSDDPLFRSFLRSGMARVVVTVKPGFEDAVLYYMNTGLIWGGGDIPVIGDKLYLSIIQELAEPEYELAESWETRVPSSLTLIQSKTVALEAEGLPCYCDEENPPNQSIVAPNPNPLTGLDVHIDGAQ